MDIIEQLERENIEMKKVIVANENIIGFSEKEYEKLENIGIHRTNATAFHLKNLARSLMQRVEENERKIQECNNIKNDRKFKVIHFKAGHREFGQDEMNKMMETVRKHFDSVPYPYFDVFGGMSDAVALFSENEISKKEAQIIMDSIIATEFNDEPALFCHAGTPFVWNGKRITLVPT